MALWLVILWLYLNNLRQYRVVGKTVAILLIILAIDAFRTLFESAYFGLYFNSLFGFLPKSIHNLLSQPQFLIIPKVINVIAGVLVLSLLVRHWLPREVKKQKDNEDRLKLSASVFTHAREGIIFTDSAGIIIDVNDMFSVITGYDRSEVIGQNPRILQSGHHDENFFSGVWASVYKQGYWAGEIWNRRKNGEIFAENLTISAVHDDRGQLQHYVGMFTDITRIKKHQNQLEYAANYDSLTNLPNRLLFSDRLNQAISHSDRRKDSIAVAFLDLDDFKVVNDTHGHSVGDQFLIQVTQEMKSVLRTSDTLARLGGDEFVIILADINEFSDCKPLLDRLISAVSKPVLIQECALSISVSMGVTLYPHDKVDAEQLLRHADQAMYIAKQNGKGKYHFFDVSANELIQSQQGHLNRIKQAIQQNQFELHYQPKVNLRSNEIIGVEALIRWQHPEKGLLYPGTFLETIQNDPLSVEIGDWVILEAIRQASEWQSAGLNLPISVNVGVLQLQSKEFVAKLVDSLGAYPKVNSSCLELEILESSAVEDIDQVSTAMQDCSDIGIHCALDDFGTGYSSLTYLKLLPVQTIKIDRSFVRDMLDDPDDRAIVSAVIGLASSFSQKVIAEGVETEEQAVELVSMGCDVIQGYWICHPLAAEQITSWIKEWNERESSNPLTRKPLPRTRSNIGNIRGHL